MIAALDLDTGRIPIAAEPSRRVLDEAVAAVRAQRRAWLDYRVSGRIALLDELLVRTLDVLDEWVELAMDAQGLTPGSPAVGEEWLSGPLILLRNLRLLRQSLRDIERVGVPQIPGGVHTREDGTVVAEVFPGSRYDSVMYRGFRAGTWMQAGVEAGSLAGTQAVACRSPDLGAVALVLGAGNVSSIAPNDALYKLLVDNRVVVLKMNPVNEWLGPLLEHALKPLLERSFLRIVYGGSGAGAYLMPSPGRGRGPHHRIAGDPRRDRVRTGYGGRGAQAPGPAPAGQADHQRAGQRQPGHRGAGAVEGAGLRVPGREPRDHAGPQRRLQLQRRASDRQRAGLGRTRTADGRAAQDPGHHPHEAALLSGLPGPLRRVPAEARGRGDDRRPGRGAALDGAERPGSRHEGGDRVRDRGFLLHRR